MKKKSIWKHMLPAIILLIGVTNAFAVDRVFLGETRGIPMAANANPETAQTLALLRQQTAKNGVARVIVGIRAAFAPEGLMSASGASLQRNEIAIAQSALLDKVSSLRQKPEKAKRFSTIPFMAIEADSAELEALATLPEITSIEEDRLAASSLAESVPLIGGTTAWASGYTGAGQTVAILDTGVDKTHPFLTGQVVSEACYSTTYTPYGATSACPGGATSSTASGSAMPYAGACPAGKCDHGTHVAGIVAGKGSSFSGVAKDASLIAIQVFSRIDNATSCGSASASPCALSYTSDQILGLERVYALRNTYNIASVNMSLGGGQYFNQSTCNSAYASIKTAIDNLRSVNIATVISSGNAGYTDSMGGPGCISSAVSVGATWDSYYASGYDCTNMPSPSNYVDYGGVDEVACFSNSASFLNLLAPGVWINSSVPGGAYSNYAGTSMAAPHVAGAWALLKQKKTTLTVTEGLNTLISTGVSVTDPRNGIVKPRVQIDVALAALPSQCTYTISPTSQTFTSSGGSGSVSVTASSSSCSWTASSSLGWATITSGSGIGSGTATFSVSANTTGASRTGNITIAGQTFIITQSDTVFADVASTNVFYSYINAIYNNNPPITVGCSQNPLMYCPDNSVTRGQMAAFIIRANYGETSTYTLTPYFSDVPATNVFFKYVQKMKDAGITAVTGTYGVNDAVTRGQVAAFIIRAIYGETFTYTSTPYFSDVPATNVFFKYVQKMKDTGITAVTGTYSVNNAVTRGQMAAFIARAFLGMP